LLAIFQLQFQFLNIFQVQNFQLYFSFSFLTFSHHRSLIVLKVTQRYDIVKGLPTHGTCCKCKNTSEITTYNSVKCNVHVATCSYYLTPLTVSLSQSHYKRLVLVCKRPMANSSNHKCLQIIQNFTVHFYENSTLHILWQPVSPASRQIATNTEHALSVRFWSWQHGQHIKSQRWHRRISGLSAFA